MKTSDVLKKLEEGIKNVLDSDKFKNYLDMMSKFHNYSAANTLLILSQCPHASYVAGFKTWNNVFGRTVNRGEKAITILAPRVHKETIEVKVFDQNTKMPVFKDGKPLTELQEIKHLYFVPVHVFDVSQTSGRPLPTLTEELKGSVQNFDKFMGAIRYLAPVPVYIRDIPGETKGFYDGKKIVIKCGMSEVQTLKTGIHELAHSILHNKDDINKAGKDRMTKEVEAESVAYTVCKRFGIDTGDYSFAYIADWGRDKSITQLRESFETIQREANLIISHIEKALGISLENKMDKINEQQSDISELGKKIDAGIATPEEIARFNQIQTQNFNKTVADLKDKVAVIPESELVR